MQHTNWSLSMPLPNIIKIFQTIMKLLSAQEFGLEIYSVFTRKRTKQELSFSLSQYGRWPAQDFGLGEWR